METRISIADFFKLIRWKNLLMIFLTQFIVKIFVIELYDFDKSLDSTYTFKYFILLSITTMLIAGAGYLINNIYDVNTDKTNLKSLLIKKIIANEKLLMTMYFLLNAIALIIGVIPTLFSQHVLLYLFFPFTIILLYYYSKKLKSTIIIGNLVVSFLTALSILIVPLFQHDFEKTVPDILFFIIFLYALFAFLVSMMREIVKDIEDIEGDFSTGLLTLPIRYGKEISKKIILFIGIITLCLIAIFFNPSVYNSEYFNIASIKFLVLFSLGIISMLFIYKAQSKKDYSRSSLFLKIWMLVGILSMCFIPKFI